MDRRFEAVIFDFGGVITASPFEAFNRLEAERGLPQDFVRKVNATNPDTNAWALFERAEIDAATFDAQFAAEAAAQVDVAAHRVHGCIVAVDGELLVAADGVDAGLLRRADHHHVHLFQALLLWVQRNR